MKNKTIKLFSLTLLIPTIIGCVRVPAKSKPIEATKVILVDASIESEKLLSIA